MPQAEITARERVAISSSAQSIAAVLSAAHDNRGGVHVVSLPGDLDSETESRLLDDARRAGFACHHPGLPVSAAHRRLLLHRHTILICSSPGDRLHAITWIRQLAFTSPRRHLVLWPGCWHADGGRRESWPRPIAVAPAALAQRARRMVARGRPRTAERWFVAAAAAADRRGDRSRAVGIQLELAATLLRSGRIAEASSRLRALLKPADLPWIDHAQAGAAWADAVLAAGDLSQASAWICSIEAEAAVRQIAVPAVIRERRARIDFWMGNPMRTSPLQDLAGATTEELGWAGLSAWRDRRGSVVDGFTDQLVSRGHNGDSLATFLSHALRGLATGLTTTPSDTPDDADIPFHLQVLSLAIRALSLLRADRPDETAAILRSVAGQSPEHRLVAAVRNHALADRDSAEALTRRSLPGIKSFFMEGKTMVSVNGLARLLKAIEDAPDELGAVAAGCAWLRRQRPAAKVAVVSVVGSRVIGACGWKAGELGTELPVECLSVPVRYGGTAIARVVVDDGDAEDSPLRDAAVALAMLLGPVVRASLDALELRTQERDGLPEILGRSQAMADVRAAIARAAATPFPVLIEGESGTGKELVARAIHRLSARRDRRFLGLNCAALTDDLLEAELFGHSRGAFTGAVGPRAGLFEDAHGGTLFLDEVADLSPRAQAKLLRVLQEREVRRLGETMARPVDVRIVSAANTALVEAAAMGRFRDDLRFRLAVVAIRLPPLRDRLEDIPLLSHVFWRRALAETGKRAHLGPDALARLTQHGWSGNVRELQNVISGLAVAAPNCGRVTARHVSQVITHGTNAAPGHEASGQPLDAARRIFERRHIAETMARHAGRRAAVAHDLGMTRQGLAKALRRLGLADDEATAGVA